MKTSTKYFKIILNILVMILAVVFFLWLLPKILVYFMPFVIAAVIALIANPLVKLLERKLKIGRKGGTAVVIVVVIALIVTVSYFVLSRLIMELIGLIESAPEIWARTSATIESFGNQIQGYLSKMPGPVQQWGNDFFSNIGNYISEFFTNSSQAASDDASRGFTANVPLVIIGIIMGILASYFFLAEKDYVVEIMERFIPGPIMSRWDLVYRTMKEAVGGYFLAQFKIMGIVYVILFIGLLILQVKYSFLIALLIALLDFLPFFGTGTVMVPWAIIALIQKNYFLGIGMLILWGVSQLVRQLVQPKFVGDSIGLDPIPTLVLLYLGFRLGGALGLIIAVPVGMIIINLYRAGVFSNFSYSMRILFNDMEKFRKFSDDELRSEGINPDEKNNKG